MYIYAVYDRILDEIPAKNTVYTPYIWFWPTLPFRYGVQRSTDRFEKERGVRRLRRGCDRINRDVQS